MLRVTWYEDRHVLSLLERHTVCLSLSVVVTSSCKCFFYTAPSSVSIKRWHLLSTAVWAKPGSSSLRFSSGRRCYLFLLRSFLGPEPEAVKGETYKGTRARFTYSHSVHRSRERNWRNDLTFHVSWRSPLVINLGRSHLQLTRPKVTHLKKHAAFVHPSFRSSQIRKTIAFYLCVWLACHLPEARHSVYDYTGHRQTCSQCPHTPHTKNTGDCENAASKKGLILNFEEYQHV